MSIILNDSGRTQVQPLFPEQVPGTSKVNGVCNEVFQSLQPISLCSRADVFQAKGGNLVPLLKSSGYRASQAATWLALASKTKSANRENNLELGITTLEYASKLNLDQDPDLKTEVLLELCKTLIWRNKDDDLDQVLAIFQDHPQIIDQIEVRALWKIGYTLIIRRQGVNPDRPISFLEKAASRLRNNRNELILSSEILIDLGNALIIRNQPQDLNRAIQHLETAKKNLLIASAKTNVKSQMLKVLCAIGNAYGTRGSSEDINQAIRLLTQASELPCDNLYVMLTVLCNLSLCLSKRNLPGDSELRIKYIQKSIELSRFESDPEKYKHLSTLICELLKRNEPGDRELLIKTLGAASQLSLPAEMKVRLYLDLGNQLRLRNRKGDLDQSIIQYRKAVEIDVKKRPQLADVLLQRGTKKDVAEANALIKRHLASMSESEKEAHKISR